MKYSLRILIGILLLSFMCCEEESIPEPRPDVSIKGTILHASDQSPIGGLVLNTLMGRNVRSQITSDSDGKYAFEIEDLRQYFMDGGMSEADADTLLAQDEISVSINASSGSSECEYFSIDPSLPQYRRADYPALPISDSWDFHLHESNVFQFVFRDTASSPRSEKILGTIRARELNQPDFYTRWTPLELELFDNAGNRFCLPLDLAVEISYRIIAYAEGDWMNHLYEKEFLDTLTMTSAGLPLYEIFY